MASERKVKLKSWDQLDNELFEVDEAVAQESQILKDLIEDCGVECVIPIPNVRRSLLAKVLQFCKYHVEADKKSQDNPAAAEFDDEIKRWDKEFLKVDHATLFRLINAAYYLNMKRLLDFTTQAVADMIEDMNLHEIRKMFKLTKDLTPEEEAQVRTETQWAFKFDIKKNNRL